MKEEICFMRRSMLLSLPVLSRVVMASVAMLRFESVTRFSRSRLQAVTADGCFMATYFGRKDKENKDKRLKKKNRTCHPIGWVWSGQSSFG